MDSPADYSRDFHVADVPEAKMAGAGEDSLETDAHRLAQRQKQVDYGKNTLGYQKYMEALNHDK